MNGFYQTGDKLNGMWLPSSGNGTGLTLIAKVGSGGVTKIEVDRADGPMGCYAIAVVYSDGDTVEFVVPLHMCAYIQV